MDITSQTKLFYPYTSQQSSKYKFQIDHQNHSDENLRRYYMNGR